MLRLATPSSITVCLFCGNLFVLKDVINLKKIIDNILLREFRYVDTGQTHSINK